jgi:hypothetical protein
MKHHVILNTLEKFKREREEILTFEPDANIWSVEETARRNPPAYHMNHCPCGHGSWGVLWMKKQMIIGVIHSAPKSARHVCSFSAFIHLGIR